jgi:hypothetical protein
VPVASGGTCSGPADAIGRFDYNPAVLATS